MLSRIEYHSLIYFQHDFEAMYSPVDGCCVLCSKRVGETTYLPDSLRAIRGRRPDGSEHIQVSQQQASSIGDFLSKESSAAPADNSRQPWRDGDALP